VEEIEHEGITAEGSANRAGTAHVSGHQAAGDGR
jgi:hypothetical protein